MDDVEFRVTEKQGELLIESDLFGDQDGTGGWALHAIDQHRLLLQSSESMAQMGGLKEGVGSVPVQVFRTFLLTLVESGYSGIVSADTGFGAKRLFFEKGDLVFAASNIIDDRLGEVMYRRSMITLEELTAAAAQVTKSQKFGQVLLKTGVFSNLNLWDALKQQVVEILRSIFLVDQVYFQLERGDGLTPTAVVLDSGSATKIHDAYAFGAQVRDFLGRLTSDSKVLIDESSAEHKGYKSGTFVGDLLTLARQTQSVQELLETSKLMDINTIAALQLLVTRGYCEVAPLTTPTRKTIDSALRSRIDAYDYVLKTVLKRFSDDGESFPMRELSVFTSTLNPDGFISIYLQANGAIHPSCLSGIFSQCAANSDRIRYFALRLESMIQFMLQVTGDVLSWEVAEAIRAEYYSLVS